MPGLLLPPRRNEDTEALGHAAHQAGWIAGRAPSYQIPEYILRTMPAPIAVYGDTLFADLAADAFGLALLEPSLDWLPGLPEHFRKREVKLTALAEARTVTEPTFIKPAEDKSFPAKVYQTTEDLAAVTIDLPDAMPLLISEPVVWESEFRVFVCNGEIAAISLYFREGKLEAERRLPRWGASAEENKDARQFTKKVLAHSADSLPYAVVVDVGIIAGKGWAVVEANPAWASSIYGCDPAKALESIAASVYPRDGVPKSEQRFVRPPITVER